MEPTVRSAAFAQLDARTVFELCRLRVDVFVVEQLCAYPELDDRDLEPQTRHFWVEADSHPVAYLRLLSEAAGGYRIGRVCVAAPARGRGLAGVLMRTAIGQIGPHPCVLDAQTYLAGWYERFGYRANGSPFVEDGIAHLPMRRD